jgi:hypothetical protein
MVSGKPLVIEGRKIWSEDAVAIPNRQNLGLTAYCR